MGLIHLYGMTLKNSLKTIYICQENSGESKFNVISAFSCKRLDEITCTNTPSFLHEQELLNKRKHSIK